MSTRLNSDCWYLVLDHLARDYRSLGRLLCVSRYMFSITVPVLYSSLFIPGGGGGDHVVMQHQQQQHSLPNYTRHNRAHQTLTDHDNDFYDYSELKKRRLVHLLLTCSGFLQQQHHYHYEHQQQQQQQHHRQHDRPSNNDPTLQNFNRWRPRFKQPMTTNYYTHLKHFLPTLEQYLEGSDSNRKVTDWIPTVQYTIHHAELLTTIVCHSTDLHQLKGFTTRFRQLISLGIRHEMTLSEFTYAKEFVTAHQVAFPGQLESIEAVNMVHHVELCELVAVRRAVFPQASIEAMVSVTTTTTTSTAITATDSNTSTAVTPLIMVSKRLFQRLHHLHISTNRYENAPLLGDFLQHCRTLQSLDLRLAYGATVPWEQIFGWAVTEHEDRQRQRQHLRPSLSPDQWKGCIQPSPPDPVRIKYLKLAGVCEAGLAAALGAFSQTLEQVRYRSPSPDTVISWTWPMMQLRRLELKNCYFEFDSLRHCSGLKILVLDGVWSFQSDSNHLWQPPLQLTELRLHGKDGYRLLDFECLPQMPYLSKVLFHSANRSTVSERIQGMDRSQWKLENLHEFSVSESYQDWDFQTLLKIAPNLKRLCTVLAKLSAASLGIEMDNDDEERGENDLVDVAERSSDDSSLNLNPTMLLEQGTWKDLARTSRLEVLNLFHHRMDIDSFYTLMRLLCVRTPTTNSQSDYEYLPRLRHLSTMASFKQADVAERDHVFVNLLERHRLERLCVMGTRPLNYWSRWLERIPWFELKYLSKLDTLESDGLRTDPPPYCILLTGIEIEGMFRLRSK